MRNERTSPARAYAERRAAAGKPAVRGGLETYAEQQAAWDRVRELIEQLGKERGDFDGPIHELACLTVLLRGASSRRQAALEQLARAAQEAAK